MLKNLSISNLISGLKFSKDIFLSIFDGFLQIGKSFRLMITHKKTISELKKLNCPLDYLKESYMFVESNHLEIFPLNGVMINNTHRLMDIFPYITALDTNNESLVNLQKTLEGSFCKIKSKLFDINNITEDSLSFEKKFTSASLNFALDQIQGGPEKIEEFLLKIKNLMSDGSIIFGLTTMGKGIEHKKKALQFIESKNNQGEWFNINYSTAELESILKNNFDQYGIIIMGSCVIFRAVINKKIPDLSNHRPTFESLKGKHLKIKPENFQTWVRNLDKFK